MENTNPSPSNSPHQSDVGKEGTPFVQVTVQISKQEHVQLKWGNRYWQRQHGRALERIAELKQELECAQAEIRDLKQRLYGKHSEKGTTLSEAQADDTTIPPRPRGQGRGSKGHGRTPRPHLPVIEEWRALPSDEQACPLCNASFDLFPGTEDSNIIEIDVKAHVRKIKCQRYKKTCQCPNVPGLITAPPAPRLIPKPVLSEVEGSSLGVSVWVEVLPKQIPVCYANPSLVRRFKKSGCTRCHGNLDWRP